MQTPPYIGSCNAKEGIINPRKKDAMNRVPERRKFCENINLNNRVFRLSEILTLSMRIFSLGKELAGKL